MSDSDRSPAPSVGDAVLVNLGCGAHFHRDWINLDIESTAEEVIAHDLTQGVPYDAGTVDACYSSHVLEHLRPHEADFFLAEQFRVLKPGGVIRVVVPDLEAIARNYLRYLEELIAGDERHEFRYDYSLLELFDQTTRDAPGGELKAAWLQDDLPPEHLDFIVSRHGEEARLIIERAQAPRRRRAAGFSWWRIREVARTAWRRARQRGAAAATRVLLGQGGAAAFREGVFRARGEIHRVMYDRYRLGRLLQRHGFLEAQVCDSAASRIANYASYELDAIGGNVRKPDSLFMEAVKPRGGAHDA